MQRKEYIAFIFAHVALFIVFVWFGSLKLFGLSPASPLVTDLFKTTIALVAPGFTADRFMVLLGLIEVLIGVFFIIPKMERFALTLLVPHMITTILPLILLPAVAWSAPFVPTLEGQYIIKNVVIIALAAMVFVDLKKKRATKHALY